MALTFSKSDELTLGVEVEVQLVDGDTLALTPASTKIIDGLGGLGGAVKHELMMANLWRSSPRSAAASGRQPTTSTAPSMPLLARRRAIMFSSAARGRTPSRPGRNRNSPRTPATSASSPAWAAWPGASISLVFMSMWGSATAKNASM